MIKLIVAADENWAIGYQNELLYHIKEDMKRFKALTTGNIVVMGRKTLESMPNGAPLPNRENVVLSSRNLKAEVTLCHTLAELGEYLRTQKKDIYIIGGETIYQELLDYCAEAEVTKIYAKKEAADAFFPDLDERGNWHIAEKSEVFSAGDINYSFVKYKNEKPKSLGELR